VTACCVRCVVACCSGVACLTLDSPVVGIAAGPRWLVVSCVPTLTGFDASTLEKKFRLVCYPHTSPFLGAVVALDADWVAYRSPVAAPDTAATVASSSGSSSSAAAPSSSGPTSLLASAADAVDGWQLRDVAKDLASRVYSLGEMGKRSLATAGDLAAAVMDPALRPDSLHSFVSLVAGQRPGRDATSTSASLPSASSSSMSPSAASVAGESIVVRDCASCAVVAEFTPHGRSAVVALAFDPSGTLLATAPDHGQTVHVYRVLPELAAGDGASHGPGTATVQLLWKLERGITHALVVGLSFSDDSEVLAVTSGHHSTHLFRIDSRAVQGWNRNAAYAVPPPPASVPSTGLSAAPSSSSSSSSVGGSSSAGAWPDRDGAQVGSRTLSKPSLPPRVAVVDDDANNPFSDAASVSATVAGGGVVAHGAGGAAVRLPKGLSVSIAESMAQWRSSRAGGGGGGGASGLPVSRSSECRVKHYPPGSGGGGARDAATGGDGSVSPAMPLDAAAPADSCVVFHDSLWALSSGLLFVFQLSMRARGATASDAGVAGVDDESALHAELVEAWDFRRRRSWRPVSATLACTLLCPCHSAALIFQCATVRVWSCGQSAGVSALECRLPDERSTALSHANASVYTSRSGRGGARPFEHAAGTREDMRAQWMSQAELATHRAPLVPLWASPLCTVRTLRPIKAPATLPLSHAAPRGGGAAVAAFDAVAALRELLDEVGPSGVTDPSRPPRPAGSDVHSAGLLCTCTVFLCCAVLCCAVLCCAVLCCAVLCCAVLCCAVLCCGCCVSMPVLSCT
jgi:hypothetical protein